MPSKLTYVILSTCIQHSEGTYGIFKQDRNILQQVVIESLPEKTTQTQSVEKWKYFFPAGWDYTQVFRIQA